MQLEWKAPDVDGLVDFLVKTHGFKYVLVLCGFSIEQDVLTYSRSEDRVRKGADKLRLRLSSKQQGRLDGFFTVQPKDPKNPKDAKKRKVRRCPLFLVDFGPGLIRVGCRRTTRRTRRARRRNRRRRRRREESAGPLLCFVVFLLVLYSLHLLFLHASSR